MTGSSELKHCEVLFNCPYYRRSVFFKCDSGKKRRKKSDERKTPEIEHIAHCCIYHKERTEITPENRASLECYYDKLIAKIKKEG